MNQRSHSNGYKVEHFVPVVLVSALVFTLSAALVAGASPDQPTLNYPPDGSTGIETDPTLNVSVSDPDANSMNVSFYKNFDPYVLRWSYDFGDKVYGVAVDSDGNVYGGGGNNDIVKLDSSGDELWRYNYGDIVESVAVDSNGNVYGGGGDYDVASDIVKLNSSGDEQWRYNYENTVYSVAVDSNGNVYGGGENNDIVKLNSSGDEQWSYNYGHSVHGVAVDSDGNIYGGGDGYGIFKLNSSGDEQWRFDDGYNYPTVDVDSDGNVYGGGSWGSSTDIVKLNSSGDEQWRYDYGDSLNSVVVDSNKNVYGGGRNYTIVKLNSSGDEQWRYDCGAIIYGVAVDSKGNFYIGGGTNTDIDKLSQFSLIGEDPDVPSGGTATYDWTGLSEETTYEWFTEADDGTSTTRSDIWNFTTLSSPPSIQLDSPSPGETLQAPVSLTGTASDETPTQITTNASVGDTWSDNFSSYDIGSDASPEWNVTDGSFNVTDVNGDKKYNNTQISDGMAISQAHSPHSWSNGYVQGEVTPASGSLPGILARASGSYINDTLDGYFCHIDQGNDEMKIAIWNDSTGSTLSKTTVSISSGQNYTVKLEAEDDQLSCYLNGTEMVTATDGSYTSGNAGILSPMTGDLYDDFKSFGGVNPFDTNFGTYQNWNFTNTSFLPERDYSVEITAEDSAGNTDSTVATFSVTEGIVPSTISVQSDNTMFEFSYGLSPDETVRILGSGKASNQTHENIGAVTGRMPVIGPGEEKNVTIGSDEASFNYNFTWYEFEEVEG